MSAPTQVRRILIGDAREPLLIFDHGRVDLGRGWSPTAAAAQFLDWLNHQLADAQAKPPETQP